MMGNIKNSSALALVAALVITQQAKAQNADDELVAEEIIVEGELRDRTLQETTTSVAVITGEELERRGDFDLYDVIERTPGVTASFGEKGFAIRGIDQRGVSTSGNGLVVSTNVDGATISASNTLTFFGPYSNWDLEQVEVLRGPQSTQTGRNALAGAIKIRSKEPTYEFEAKARGELGVRDTKGASFAVNVPIIDDTLAVRFSADDRRTDGFVENPTLGTDSFDNRVSQTLRGSVKFEPTDNIEIVGKFFHSRNEGGEDLIEEATFPDQFLNFSNVPAREKAVIDSGNLRFTWDINDELSFESSTNYMDSTYSRVEDSDFSAFDAGFIFRTSEVEAFEQEIKFIYESDRWSGVLGGYFTDISDVAPAGGVIPASFLNPAFAAIPGATITAEIDQDTQTQNWAIFGEAEYRILPQLGLIAGLRYDREQVDITTVNDFVSDNAAVAAFLPPATTETDSTEFSALLPKAGITYDITDDVTVGFVVQRGYRAGGTSVNIATGERREVDPEYTWNYELSLRSEWFDDRLTLNANAFYTRWTDQQIEVLGPSGLQLDSITENAGESRLFGGELEVRANPIPKLDLFASFAYVDTKFTTFVTSQGDFTGNEFTFAPDITMAFGGEYFFDNGMYVGADASYTAESFSDLNNSALLTNDSRFLLNARVGFEHENFGIFAYARNILDEDYATQKVLDGTGTSVQRLRAGEPLTFGLVGTVGF